VIMRLLQGLVTYGVLAGALHSWAAPAVQKEFSFAVVSHPIHNAADESGLRTSLEETDTENLAFVVVNGIKAGDEACSDNIYSERKALLQSAKNGVIVSLAASDWLECGNHSKLAAIGRLGRLRDMLFVDEFSTGGSKLPLVRQSATPKFRSYAENARWEIGDVMFATVNLPRDNNHYSAAAGRNSEFEDRLIANRDWLHRIFIVAARKKLSGIVLFSDGNPLAPPRNNSMRDGFAEIRRHITALASKFEGKVLIVHGDTGTALGSILWRTNVGELAVPSSWLKVAINPAHSELFNVESESAQSANVR
jgi:hypothetical protein